MLLMLQVMRIYLNIHISIFSPAGLSVYFSLKVQGVVVVSLTSAMVWAWALVS